MNINTSYLKENDVIVVATSGGPDSMFLLNYLNEPNDNTVLILVLKEKMNGTKKISKLVKERYNYIEITNPNQKETRDIINTFMDQYKDTDYDLSLAMVKLSSIKDIISSGLKNIS